MRPLLLILLLTLSGITRGQSESKSGIYRTYKDFENNNLEKVGTVVTYGADWPWQLSSVTFELRGKRTNYNYKSCWGFEDEFGNSYRFDKGKLYKVLITGDVSVYGDITSGHTGEGGLIGNWFKVSKGVDGDIISYNKFDQFLVENYPQVYLEYKTDNRKLENKFLYYVDKCNNGNGVRR